MPSTIAHSLGNANNELESPGSTLSATMRYKRSHQGI